jgi:pimeloyl-ACP methyl ester carboxylesterase
MAIPIIFVPGVMGSRLFLPPLTQPPPPNWDPDNKLSMLPFLTLDLNTRLNHLSVSSRRQADCLSTFAAGVVDVIAANPVMAAIAQSAQQTVEVHYAQRGWPTVARTYYGDLLLLLETTFNIGTPLLTTLSNPVHAFGYDWRLSNAINATKLSAKIDEVLAVHEDSNNVILVTHSMGGLVARAACLDETVQTKVRGVIHVAQPITGAVVLYRRFRTGFRSGLDSPDDAGMGFFLQHLFGSDATAHASLMAGIPAAIELLPNTRYTQPSGPWLVTDPPSDLQDIYTVYQQTSPPGIVDPGLVIGSAGLTGVFLQAQLIASIGSARAFHARLGDSAHPNTFVISSTGLPTDLAVDFTTADLTINRGRSGDGTVPDTSANGSGLQSGFVKGTAVVNGLEHAKIFQPTATQLGPVPSAASLNVVEFIRRILSTNPL